MAHGRRGETTCTATWPITGRACLHLPVDESGCCAAHHPDGDKRRPPPCDADRCTATTKETGERCRHHRGPDGAPVCRYHGGGAPQVKVAAQRRGVDAELERMATLVGTPVGNPLTELSRVAGRSRAWMEMLEERVQALLDAQDGDGRCPHCGEDLEDAAGSLRYRGGAGEQIRGEVQLYERAMDRLGRLLADIGRLKIDERLAAITSKQADAVIAALEAGLNAAGVREPAQRTAAKSAASRELRLVR